MHYSAKVLRLSDDIEEEVTLVIDGRKLVCFANMLPYGVKEGQSHQVELIPMVFNDYVIHELSDDISPSFTQIGYSFSYTIVGKLTGNVLNVGSIEFQDDYLLSDFGYLDGKMISWEVDRIDVEFE